LPDAVVRYAEHPDGLLDLHLPSERPRGRVVLLHGGFWRSAWDRTHIRPFASALRDEGYLVASPEYRRTGAAPDRLGGWPRTGHDVRTVVSRLPELLTAAAVSRPDRSRGPTVVVGHSAGGHLALWLASERLQVDLVVALAPVGDLRHGHRHSLGSGAVEQLLGGTPGQLPERYDEADPAVRLRTPPGRQVVVVHGAADESVPLGNSDWARGLRHVDLRVLDGVDHMALVDPASCAWPAVLAAVEGARGEPGHPVSDR
jgi:acetyl esterase/lipase